MPALVRVTVAVEGRVVPVEDLVDQRIAFALRGAGQGIALRLAAIHCPVHSQTASNVRVHFDAGGSANLQYESCCQGLGTRIGETLG